MNTFSVFAKLSGRPRSPWCTSARESDDAILPKEDNHCHRYNRCWYAINSNDVHVSFFLQVVQNGLEILTYLADRMGHDFKPYISTIIQPTIDRLGEYMNMIIILSILFICLKKKLSLRRNRNKRYLSTEKNSLMIMTTGNFAVYDNSFDGSLYIFLMHLRK